jgi:SAM-dependent methyltransferase
VDVDDGTRAGCCPMCGGDAVVDVSDRWRSGDPLRDFPLAACRGCETLFVDPIPSPDVIAASYPHDFYGERAGATKGLEDWFLRRRLALAGSVAGRRVLDVGSGDGKFLHAAAAAGARVTAGVEPSTVGRTSAAALGLATVAGLDDLPEGDEFDVVTLWHVVEHAADPAQLAADVADRVAPGGRLVLALPDAGSAEARWGRGSWFHLDLPRHLVFPPADVLRRRFEALGLRHVRTHRFSIEYDPYGLLQTVLNRFGRRHNALYHRLKRKQPLASFDRRGRIEVVIGLVTLPITAPLAVVVAWLLGRWGRAGTYTLVMERP